VDIWRVNDVRWLSRTLVACATAVAVLASPASAGAASSIWHVVPSPNPGANTVSDTNFTGVSATSAADAWGVGINMTSDALLHPLLEHWDGHGWKLVTPPEPTGRQSELHGVDAVSATDVWAVGVSSSRQSSNLDERTLIEHWNGTAWTIVPSPNPSVGSNSADVLEAVGGVGPSDLWAVGWEVVNNTIAMLFEHFDGSAWKATPTAAGSPTFGFAMAVNAVATNDVWAVGSDQSSAQGLTLAAHWDGRSWTIVPTPSLFDGNSPQNFLTGVTSVGSRDVWASGYEDNVNNTNFAKPYLLHWNGTSWALALTPNLGGEGSRLRATAALAANDVWAVGQTQQLNGSILTLTEHFNGTTWSVVPSPDPGHVGTLLNNSLDSLASPGGHVVFALGAQEIKGQCCLRTLALETSQG
jgi:hypothetical protein